MQKIVLSIFLLCSIVVNAQEYSIKTVPNIHLQDADKYVTNPDGIINSYSEQSINSMISRIEYQTTVQIAVVLLNSVEDDEDIDLFGTDLFEYWGLGAANDNGLLFLLIKDQREMIFRTGYGLEGVLPDAVLSRIIRNVISPRMKEGDFDGGVVEGIDAVCRILEDPSYAEEISYKSEDTDVAIVILVIVLILCFLPWILSEIYPENKTLKIIKWIFFVLVIPFAIFIYPILSFIRNKILRYKTIKCKCGLPMRRLKEREEDEYLKSYQIVEENIKSVDYDVWLCNCREIKIKKYDKSFSKYSKCAVCKAKAKYTSSDKVLLKATRRSKGKGIRTFLCKNCGDTFQRNYTIPIITDSDSGSSSSSSSGGSSGGSWGGGSTGGGGARGGW